MCVIMFVINDMLLLRILNEEELSKETHPSMEGNVLSLIMVDNNLSCHDKTPTESKQTC